MPKIWDLFLSFEFFLLEIWFFSSWVFSLMAKKQACSKQRLPPIEAIPFKAGCLLHKPLPNRSSSIGMELLMGALNQNWFCLERSICKENILSCVVVEGMKGKRKRYVIDYFLWNISCDCLMVIITNFIEWKKQGIWNKLTGIALHFEIK